MDLKTVSDSTPALKKVPLNSHRIFRAEFKQHLIGPCQQPDTSVAKVVIQHQINADLPHKCASLKGVK
ncbi:IS66 family insertion sequence hypothetical protein [Acinetobacter sp. ANC 4635]|nr:IS66 family insertion sequence hypothetical protein [Acinetobacter sp. ANC 4635]